MRHAKRWLYLVHRWLGVLLCSVFALWFVSGIVMMSVGYPKLTEAERLQHLPPLGTGSGLLAPREALDAAGIAGPLKELRLAAASGGRAVYLAVRSILYPTQVVIPVGTILFMFLSHRLQLLLKCLVLLLGIIPLAQQHVTLLLQLLALRLPL